VVCPFHFYGICNEQESDATCVYGKISQVLTSPVFMGYSQYITGWCQYEILADLGKFKFL